MNTNTNNQGWRTNCAADMLRRKGYLIVDIQSHPTPKSVEIDLVVWRESDDTMVCVAVGGGAGLTRYSGGLADRNYKRRERRLVAAFRRWVKINKWHGECEMARCDVYGTPEAGRPIIDLIEKVGNL
jgi:Holliday junction resolvase-like predicted endonuclease